VPVIIWINGGFGAGKTTLAQELGRRLPDAVVYDPEDVGLMLWKWIPPNGDFQHLPSWPTRCWPGPACIRSTGTTSRYDRRDR
jgi:hypothetical protein